MTSINPHLRLKLDTALVHYDQREERRAATTPRGYYNPYAMSHYLRSLQATISDVHRGASLGRALYDHFNGRLLTTMERAAGLPVTYGGGPKDRGRPE